MVMRQKFLFACLLLTLPIVLAQVASAQTNWVTQFLNRYQPPSVDPASTVTPQSCYAPWRWMVREGGRPSSAGDVIHLMLDSNLDVTVNRFSPLSSGYFIDTLFLPFEPTLTVGTTIGRSTQPVASQLTAGAGVTALS